MAQNQFLPKKMKDFWAVVAKDRSRKAISRQRDVTLLKSLAKIMPKTVPMFIEGTKMAVSLTSVILVEGFKGCGT